MISLLTRRKEPQKIGVVELDATIRENHNFRNTMTNYPVEDGFDITDHVKVEPEVIDIEGFVTNTPVRILGGRGGEFLFREDFSNKVQLTFNALLEISGRKIANVKEGTTIQIGEVQIIDVITILNVYTNMVIIGLRFPVSKNGGNAQYFMCTLRKLIKVKSDITVVQNISDLGGKAANVENQAAEKTKAGKQSTTEPEVSIFEKIVSAVENKLGKTVQ